MGDKDNVLQFPRGGREADNDIKELQRMAREDDFPSPPTSREDALQHGHDVIVHGIAEAARRRKTGENFRPSQ